MCVRSTSFNVSVYISVWQKTTNKSEKKNLHKQVENFKKIKIRYPEDRKEQDNITEILSTADREIDLLQQELEQEKQKKKALMQLLLTGIVRVKIWLFFESTTGVILAKFLQRKTEYFIISIQQNMAIKKSMFM